MDRLGSEFGFQNFRMKNAFYTLRNNKTSDMYKKGISTKYTYNDMFTFESITLCKQILLKIGKTNNHVECNDTSNDLFTNNEINLNRKCTRCPAENETTTTNEFDQ